MARIYVVKAGDSLSKIAQELLGDAKRWTEILQANKDRITNPDAIYAGQELLIPVAEAESATKDRPQSAESDRPVVRGGLQQE